MTTASEEQTHAPAGSVTVDLDLRVIDADPTFCSLVGFERDTVVGSPVGVFLREEEMHALVGTPSSGAGAHGPVLVETQCERPDGRLIWVRLGVTLLDDGTSGVLRRMDVLGYGDERRHGEGDGRRRGHAARDEREERLRHLVDAAPDVVYRFRFYPTAAFEYVSRAAGPILGRRPEEYYTRPDLFIATTHPADVATARRIFTAPSVRGVVTLRAVHSDGHVVWLEHRVVPDVNDQGRVVAVEGIARDVTERQRAMAEARRRSVELELLKDVAVAANQAETVDEALQIAVDRVCAVTRWPVGHAYLVGDGGGRLVPTRIWHVDDPRQFAPFVAATERTVIPVGWGLTGEVAASGQAVSRIDVTDDPTFVRADKGEQLGVRAAMAFPVLIGSEVVAVLEFFSDRDRGIDDALLNLMQHVGTELGRVMERARGEAERGRLDDAKTEFIVNAAHELRNPVGALAQLTTLLSSDWMELTEEQLRWAFDALGAQGRWLTHLAGQLLDLSQLDEGKVTLDRREVAVPELVDQVLHTLPPPDGTRVTVEVPAEVVLRTDRLRLEQILVNLVQNAYRYGGRHIKVSGLLMRESIEVSVADDGPGLDAELAERVFEPFTRGAQVDSEGSGLGLAVVRRLARLLGGDVRHERVTPSGAKFAVRLPRGV